MAEINALEFLGISHIADSSGRYHCDYIRTPIGAYINHSRSPNCAKVAVGGGDDSHRLLEDGETSSLMGIQASRSLKAGGVTVRDENGAIMGTLSAPTKARR